MFRYTPYDGSKRPFSIGLEPVPQERWFDPDERFAEQLARKRELMATVPDVVIHSEPETLAAQAEAFALLSEHLPAAHPDLYRAEGGGVALQADGSVFRMQGAEPPLQTISRAVQEDLVLMRKGEGGWRLAAASLCFPSSWSLAAKASQPMAQIHEHVPGYAGRMGQTIDRIFDNLKPGQLVARLNWSVYDSPELHHSRPKQMSPQMAEGEGAMLAGAFIRVERQTLSRLPDSGDLLFTIKIHHDPLRLLAAQPGARELAAGLVEQLGSLDEAQLRYKGLTLHRDQLVADLASVR
ncbi:Protein of uncharacterised function (DUF3445) [Pannonibacter phragmitetus]|uniref:Protein of uncharacterized function (DUF3445) n=1 Tax=Pannonibacter phragmitetus TaxID=121719 RepID=A0A379A0G2_9HYPH|nr:DUF3445 domain-containing protein [Pannonibacter phragmitetus]SUB02580.1 Protein of uncharacterised function (DUF3445) [Pannonibacter phragmitetus]